MGDRIDPASWLQELVRGLRVNGDIYNAAASSDRRYIAAAHISALAGYLKSLPDLADCEALASLKDAASALWDLEQGKRHPWGKPKGGSGSTLGVAQQELKYRSVLAAEVMMGAGYTAGEADRAIANILQATGRSGREDVAAGRTGAFKEGTIRRWRWECAAPGRDGRGQRFVQRELSHLKSDPAWPPTRQEALAYAEQRLTSRLLRDRFIS